MVMQKTQFRNLNQGGKLRILFLSQVTTLCFSLSYTLTAVGLRSFSPPVLSFFKTLSASLAFLVYALIIKMPFPKKRDIPGLVLSAVFEFTIHNLASSAAQKTIPVGLVSIFSKFVPIIVTIMAVIFMKEHITAVSWCGLITAFLGVLWIIGSNGFGKFEPGFGYIFLIIMVLCDAYGTIIQKGLLERLTSAQVMGFSTWISLLTLSGNIPGFIRELPSASLSAVLAVIVLGITSGVAAFVCWGIVLNTIPAGEAETFLYPSTPGAIILGWIFLGEKPTIHVWIGLLIIFLGIYLIGSGKKKMRNEE